MKNLSIKILFACVFACVCVVCVSAQCVADEKQALKLQNEVKSIEQNKTGEEKEKYYNQQVRKNPTCFWFYVLRGNRYFYIGQRHELALADFKKAYELVSLTTSPTWKFETEFWILSEKKLLEPISEIGNKANKKQDNKLCIDAYNFALDLRKDAQFLFGRGDCLFNSGQYEPAADDYLQAIRLTDSATAIRGIVQMLKLTNLPHKEKFYPESCRLKSQNKDFDNAINDCNEALKIDANFSEAKQLIATANEQAKRKKADDELAIANANTKRVEDEKRQAAEQKSKENRKKTEAEEKADDPRGYLQRTNPKQFEMMRLAIEIKDPKAIAYVLSHSDYEEDLLSDYYADYEVTLAIKQDVGHIRIKFLGQNGNVVLAILRPVSITLNGKYTNNGKTDLLRRGEYGGAYSFNVSGDTLNLNKANGQPYNIRTFGQMWQQDTEWVRSLANFCGCNVDGSFPQSFRLTGALTDFTRVKIGWINWDGSVTLFAYDTNGKEYRFNGHYSF